MDWETIATLGLGASVPLTGQVITALTKRGDRKHQSELEVDKRLWDYKREALLTVIHWAKGVQAAAAPVSDQLVLSYRRADILLFVTNNPMEAEDEVAAFVARDVEQRYERLQSLIDTAMKVPIRMMLAQINTELQAPAAAKKVLPSELQMKDLITIGSSAANVAKLQALIDGGPSPLDPDEVQRLAGELVEAARNDLGVS